MVSEWLETNRAFYKAMDESNDFFMNVMFDMYAKRGLPSGALELLRKAHPTESEAQLRARYLCPFVPVPGQRGTAWERTDEHQDAAAAAVLVAERMEVQRLEEERLAKAREEDALEQLEQRRREEQQRKREEQREAKKASKKAAAAKAIEEEAALAEALAEVEKAAAAKKEAAAKKAAVALEQEAKAKAKAETARAEARSVMEVRVLRRQADMDMDAMLNLPKFFPQLGGVPNIPLQLAMYSFLFCCLMRQTLMMEVLLHFSRWVCMAKLPPAAKFSELFKNHDMRPSDRKALPPPLYLNCSNKTAAAQLIVQTARNIVGIVLDLRKLVDVGSKAEAEDYSPEFHSHFQVMYSICNQRQFSMSVLEGIDVLGPSPELLALYKAVQLFENFCGGSDFVVFRQCFPLPTLPTMTLERLPGKTAQQTQDFFLNIGMSPNASAEMSATQHAHKQLAESGVKQSSEAQAWYQYLQALIGKPGETNIFDATRFVWRANFTTVCKWSKAPPALETLNSSPAFEELLPSWFGAEPGVKLQFTEREDFATQVLEDCIYACGLSLGKEESQSQILAFLLADGEGSALYDWSSTRAPLPPLLLPFTTTIQKVRAIALAAR